MKIEDLIQLLNNRLREFKLSGDYARMSGDLERMNVADKEVLALEDTLFKLNLLVDTSKSAAVKEEILAEVITDGSVAVLGEYDITPYATDPLHEEKIMNILSKMGVMDTVEKIDKYIKSKALSSPVTGEMIMSATLAYEVDARLMMAIMEQDSSFGTAGLAVRTLNPGNMGNNDDGDTVTYESWQEGVTAVAEWLSRHRGSTIIPETPLETPLETVATSTPSIIAPTATSTSSWQATSTPIITTSTTTTITNIPTISTSTTTPTTTTSTTTPITSTSTPQIVTPAATTTPAVTATSTPQTITPVATTTPAVTATSTPQTITPVATTTPVITTAPVISDQDSSSSSGTEQADSSTPSTATSTPAMATSTAN